MTKSREALKDALVRLIAAGDETTASSCIVGSCRAGHVSKHEASRIEDAMDVAIKGGAPYQTGIVLHAIAW